MIHGNAAPISRAFTIHFKGELFRALIDCRTALTLRDLIAVAVPNPSGSNSSSTTTGDFSTDWVDNCICAFGGQRLSLDTLTESAPLVLDVSWSESARGGTRKRMRRDFTFFKEEDRNLLPCKVSQEEIGYSGRKSGSKEIKNNIDDKYSVFDAKSGIVLSFDSSSRYGVEGKFSADDNNSNDNSCSSDDGEDDDCINSEGRTPCEDYDDRQYEAILPVVVGGVVRLVNMESRDKSHEWTVYVRGLFNESKYLADCIESVRFFLDASFTPSERLVTSPPFELTEVGWGEFIVKVSIQLRHYPRPIQIDLSSSSASPVTSGVVKSPSLLPLLPTSAETLSDVKVASAILSPSTADGPLIGLTNGPALSPLISVLSRHHYHGCASDSVDHTIVKKEEEEEGDDQCTKCDAKRNVFGSTEKAEEAGRRAQNNNCVNVLFNPNASVSSDVETLGTCSGVVVLSHLLRFSHRVKRFHCIPPLGRPYEPEEHVGYTLVQHPVVTEHYDEIVIPDAPLEVKKALASLPELLQNRVSSVKGVRAPTTQQQGNHRGSTTLHRDAVASIYAEDGVSCWKYIKHEELDDIALAEAYLDNLSTCPKSFFHVDSHVVEANQPLALPRPGRGRRKLMGAEIDLAALRAAKKGLTDVIGRMRREAVLRQAAHIYQQYT